MNFQIREGTVFLLLASRSQSPAQGLHVISADKYWWKEGKKSRGYYLEKS